MHRRLSSLLGATVHALDGDVGAVHDFYFDDVHWVVRYVVVDSGNLLNRRRVVLSVMSLAEGDAEAGELAASLARDQIRSSPEMEEHPHVSRASERELLSHYGYPFYWAGDALWGRVAEPTEAARQMGALPLGAPDEADDPHIHSVNEVLGYVVHARDGEAGHVDDLLVEPVSWGVESLLVGVGPAGDVRVAPLAPSSIGRIDWIARSIRVNLSRDTIAASAGTAAPKVRST